MLYTFAYSISRKNCYILYRIKRFIVVFPIFINYKNFYCFDTEYFILLIFMQSSISETLTKKCNLRRILKSLF